MIRKMLFGIIFGLVCASGAIARASGATTSEVPLPQHGSMQFKLPDGWQFSVRQPEGQIPPTIRVQQKAGSSFEILVTPIWSFNHEAPAPSDRSLRQQVQQAADAAQESAVEKKLVVKELTGVAGRGYYFSATDRAPKPGEYKYLNQGILRVDDLMVTFTILTNDGQEAVISNAFTMLKSIARSSHLPRESAR